ncbi:Mus7/MMS22 family-domain-containing protein [Achaetomium macrosporum]|uniref:Mus7/MMS22 family-domain-containing protein n=1 Tax=Achaetomium macrosporum TaxID=79813 RepID=A0AAN7CE12_9PEZI|nr:Mus7/MMS22 family-domain-containing protein [Achaetomium macrosporum]
MRNWRELGEVPDSDDESFDDTEFHDDDQPNQLPREDVDEPRVEERRSKSAKDGDVWSVPSSSPESVSAFRSVTLGQASQVLSQSPLPGPSTSKQNERTKLSIPSEKLDKPALPTGKRPDIATDSFLEDEISTGYVRVATQSSPASSPPSLLSKTPTPPDSPSLPPSRTTSPHARLSPPPDKGAFPDDPEDLSKQTAVRLERSLRPRKPIQQHPYLLENAQYTVFMKSHGVKPIRVIPEAQPARRRAEEEDSQDQEFQMEESQETSREDPSAVEEDAPVLFDDDEDELALTPSLSKTSPLGQLLQTSSQRTDADRTDATSLSDEDLPPLERLRPLPAKERRRILKRQRSQPLSSAKRKKPRFILGSSQGSSPQRPGFIRPPSPDIWDLSSSPTAPKSTQEPSRRPETVPRSPAWRRSNTPGASVQRPASTTGIPTNGSAGSPIVINEDPESDPSDGELSSSAHSSDSESDAIRQNSRRIRGVLPASWLRLDRHQEKPVPRSVRRRSPEPSPDRGFRRGVALPRQGSPKPSSTAPLVLFDDTEESDSEPPERRTAANDLVRTAPVAITLDEDDGASVVEEDTIDWMLPGRKRTGPQTTSGRAKKQKRSVTESIFTGVSNQPSRQPKITQVLNRSKHGVASTSAKRGSVNSERRRRDGSSANRGSRKRSATPPLLSILDVVEPNAPRFVKIAARAVKRKANLGKTNPSKKIINLATRSDNLDALSVLRDWKLGKMKPRISVPESRLTGRQSSRPALREVSTNTALRPPRTHPQHLIRQSSLDSFVTVDGGKDRQVPQPPSISALQPRKPLQVRQPSFHPAQLETDEREDKRRQLSSRKRSLDAFYRKTRRKLDSSTDDGLDAILDVNFTLQEHVAAEQNDNDAILGEENSTSSRRKKGDARSRFRKGRRPQCIDLEAPQYTRANDPLPADLSIIETQEIQEHHSQDKLKGLGPYGTHYTHHFEIFPLDSGVFFHESTVIGRGLLRDAIDATLPDRIRHHRPAASFNLDGQVLRWGAWDDNTSSELGILVDWVAEQMISKTASGEGLGRKAIEAADFVLGYILRSLSVRSELEEKAFVSRCLEVFSSFISRFESIEWSAIPDDSKKTHLEVVVRFSLAILAVHSLSKASATDPIGSTRLDGLLEKSASITIRRLLECGTEELRTLYGDLQRATFRERGIRPDRFLGNCWVVMMRLLESAALPRRSFWDVTHSVMLSQGAASSSDAATFERLWQNMFTLLPLCEVDASGILVPGLRHTAPMEGWALPQQLLKRVFQLYQANPRQPPGFNDYCRALVARCHFLVQQWGWRKCTGIIGTIFDFFGSQSLAHLRNEEVYKSPRFLEELDGKPSLSIEPEDRCFHIFIKLLALTIQRLKDSARVNDIRNLVARTLPNHNRQYLKEDVIHQHDLAALRNHHDLLCTLFWVSPPDLRPAVHLIEKLVVPGSAHKEACLINVRAWNQLARFVISNGEGGAAFRPLAAWRNNIFNQVLDQYLSAASDIEQQFRALSTEIPGISRAVRDDMIAKNKATALDVLHFCVKASYDVLERAPTLEAALYALSTAKLQKIFTSLDYQSPGFDWSIVRVALDTLEHFIERIDRASEEQYSSEFSDNVDNAHVEDAVLLVNEQLTKDFFCLGRAILALPLEQSLRHHNQQSACAEKTVTLAARIAARFVKNRITQLSSFFSHGKCGLFSDPPKSLTTPERRYLPLFIAVLVKNHVFDFKDLGIDILGLWMLSIVKPQRLLGYENYLADVLQHNDLPFLERAAVAVGIPPDYNSNLDFFACAIHYVRKSLRDSGPLVQSRQHREEYSKTLQLVMRKMKEDLALLQPFPNEHGPYVDFVRQVISLIKSHGVGVCAVDPFFTQPSVDYSPPVQDPQLHTAGIIAYGVRLSEKDVHAVPQLFYYLYNNFKLALGNDKLDQECRILAKAMRNAHVTSFMLQFMVPAMIQASAQAQDCWALLQVYAIALGNLLDSACVPEELAADDMEHVAGILNCLLAWFDGLRSAATLSLQQLHIMALLATMANTLQPSLTSYLVNGPDSAVPGLQGTVGALSEMFAGARCYLGEILSLPDRELTESSVRVPVLLGRLLPIPAPNLGAPGNPRVQEFTKSIVSDVRQNWVVSRDRVMVRMASGRGGVGGVTPAMSQAASGSLQGTRYVPWEIRGALERLYGAVAGWDLGVVREGRTGRAERMERVTDGEDLLF